MAQITLLKNSDGTQLLPQTSYDALVDKEKIASADDVEELIEVDGTLKKKLTDLNAANSAWTEWDSNGVNLLNGAEVANDANDYPQYRTRKVGGATQVELTFNIKNVLAGGNKPYVLIPTNILPVARTKQSFVFALSSGQTASWNIDGGGNINLQGNSAGSYKAVDNYPAVMQWEVI